MDFYNEYKALVTAYYNNRLSWVEFVKQAIALQDKHWKE